MIYASEIIIFKDSINQGWEQMFNRSLNIKEENFAIDQYEHWLKQGLFSNDIITNGYNKPLPLINYIMREVYFKFNLTK